MFKLNWHEKDVPNSMRVTQVYGVIYTHDGRTLLKVETKSDGRLVYSLAGGTPETYDVDRVATLKRELIEEVNTTINEPIYLGYQEVIEDDKDPYAQVRMVAMIDEIGEVKPDPDNGETYQRLLTTPSRAIELLNWGDIGKNLIEKSFKVAKDQLGLNNFNSKEEYV